MVGAGSGCHTSGISRPSWSSRAWWLLEVASPVPFASLCQQRGLGQLGICGGNRLFLIKVSLVKACLILRPKGLRSRGRANKHKMTETGGLGPSLSCSWGGSQI